MPTDRAIPCSTVAGPAAAAPEEPPEPAATTVYTYSVPTVAVRSMNSRTPEPTVATSSAAADIGPEAEAAASRLIVNCDTRAPSWVQDTTIWPFTGSADAFVGAAGGPEPPPPSPPPPPPPQAASNKLSSSGNTGKRTRLYRARDRSSGKSLDSLAMAAPGCSCRQHPPSCPSGARPAQRVAPRMASTPAARPITQVASAAITPCRTTASQMCPAKRARSASTT